MRRSGAIRAAREPLSRRAYKQPREVDREETPTPPSAFKSPQEKLMAPACGYPTEKPPDPRMDAVARAGRNDLAQALDVPELRVPEPLLHEMTVFSAQADANVRLCRRDRRCKSPPLQALARCDQTGKRCLSPSPAEELYREAKSAIPVAQALLPVDV